jgi:hypothetical protein
VTFVLAIVPEWRDSARPSYFEQNHFWSRPSLGFQAGYLRSDDWTAGRTRNRQPQPLDPWIPRMVFRWRGLNAFEPIGSNRAHREPQGKKPKVELTPDLLFHTVRQCA